MAHDKPTQFEIINSIPKGFPIEYINDDIGIWFWNNPQNRQNRKGFVRCYYVECVYNSSNGMDTAYNENPYGICVRNTEGDKITVNKDKVCVSYET